jgi:hypothetical protein
MTIGPILLAVVLATAAQFDRAGRACFAALRDFQVIELREVQAHHAWPTEEQHKQIAAKLAIAYEGVADSLPLGIQYVAGHPQALSWLRSVNVAVGALSGLVGPLAPKDARQTIQTVQDRFAALLALYPVGTIDEHPPIR